MSAHGNAHLGNFDFYASPEQNLDQQYALLVAWRSLGIRDGLDVVYAEKIRGHAGVDVPSRVGGRLPLSSTGVGKALLAYAEPAVVEGVLSRPLRRLTEHSITDPARLADQLAEIRRTGLAYDREEAAPGVGCIAAPVPVRGHAVAALSLTLPSEHVGTAGPANALRVVSLTLARTLAGRNAD